MGNVNLSNIISGTQWEKKTANIICCSIQQEEEKRIYKIESSLYFFIFNFSWSRPLWSQRKNNQGEGMQLEWIGKVSYLSM